MHTKLQTTHYIFHAMHTKLQTTQYIFHVMHTKRQTTHYIGLVMHTKLQTIHYIFHVMPPNYLCQPCLPPAEPLPPHLARRISGICPLEAARPEQEGGHRAGGEKGKCETAVMQAGDTCAWTMM